MPVHAVVDHAELAAFVAAAGTDTLTDFAGIPAGIENTYYAPRRPSTPEEGLIWPTALRAAALRFWLSRLEDRDLPRLGEVTRTWDTRMCRCRLTTAAACHPWAAWPSEPTIWSAPATGVTHWFLWITLWSKR